MGNPVLTQEKREALNLAQMRNVDLLSVDRESLTDITSVVIDQHLSVREKSLQLVRQINPYCYKQDGYVVKISHAARGLRLDESLSACLRNEA